MTPVLPVRHTLTWLPRHADNAALKQSIADFLAHAAPALIAGRDETSLHWRRDDLGKPFIAWQGKAVEGLHVSNSHDGAHHLVLAAYDTGLAGIGVDLVHLPRLEGPNKNAAYLHRFAAHFMGPEEQAAFHAESLPDDTDALRLRVAAHFSLMESASKACGTGLKIGGGMGKSTSLPKQSLGALSLRPVKLWLGAEAQARLAELNVVRWEGFWQVEGEYLVSIVLLWTAGI